MGKVGVLRANGAAPHPPTPWSRVKSVSEWASHRATARPPHASRRRHAD
ncbi:MAG: hypothetical protein NZ455_11410 [Bacteroidia bacterium]|nr:hypothetical protein [Bacteroidia bacterium]